MTVICCTGIAHQVGHKLGTEHKLLNGLHIPNNAKPGEYILNTTVVNECSDGLHTVEAPPLRFRIIEAPDARRRR